MNLNLPGTYFHWSIFTISSANLIIIIIMVIIFGIALLLPFPQEKIQESVTNSEEENQQSEISEDANNGTWTVAARRWLLKALPPHKLLPGTQPAYVSSWIYIFGVATLAALVFVILSGMTLAINGPDWWHTSNIGHFVNSVHLWSVELFMAFMVIHLWGKFWMAAWRGKRALTWITGGIAFGASIIECFTGYLSQQNFDSQWIATNGKDAINATGLGSFFNLMNFGQMLLWHVVLIPIVLIAFIGAHVLLVRMRGVSHPLPEKSVKGREEKKKEALSDAADWHGPNVRYDILKEGVIATAIVSVIVVVFALVLSSPDLPPVTVATWAKVSPADFMATAASELAGTSETANYGQPYNNGSSNVQGVGISWQMLAGVRQPINPAQTFVLSPLTANASNNTSLADALSIYQNASFSQQQTWAQNYLTAVQNVTFNSNGIPQVPAVDDGTVPILISNELTLAQSGAIDTALLAQQPFYGTNYTKPLLFLEDGSYYASLAKQQNLTGTQWGVMNETGSYPGQPWLWLYTLWYQLPGLSSSPNIDLIAVYLTGIATFLLLFIPFIPGLRDIPRIIPIHRLIWGKWNKMNPNEQTPVAQ